MLKYTEAQSLLQQQARSFGTEIVSLDQVLGRVLAEKIVADRDYPPFNRSAMDGYALKYDDVKNGMRKFEMVETIYAGTVPATNITSGQCYKIMTGAALPPDADLVVRKEDVKETAPFITLYAENYRLYQNIARKGEDIQAGFEIISTHCKCEPPIVSLLATLGKSKIRVERLPQVALFTTGNEVVAVDAPANPVQIRNSNQWLLKSLLQEWGIHPFICHHLPDDISTLRQSLEKALSADIIMLSGGVSAGEADYVPMVLEQLGVEKLFHKVAIKPGKPLWCGITPTGGMVFALPGNPFSCLVTFTLFIQHYLQSCFQLSDTSLIHLPFQGNRKKKPGLDEFFPVRISGSPAAIKPVPINGSGDIRLGLYAQGLGLHPADCPELQTGEIVSCYPLV